MSELLRAMFLRDSLLLLCYAVENNNKFNNTLYTKKEMEPVGVVPDTGYIGYPVSGRPALPGAFFGIRHLAG